jgi:hypothetical protein
MDLTMYPTVCTLMKLLPFVITSPPTRHPRGATRSSGSVSVLVGVELLAELQAEVLHSLKRLEVRFSATVGEEAEVEVALV